VRECCGGGMLARAAAQMHCAHQLMDNMLASASQSLRLPLDAHAAASATLDELLLSTSLLAPCFELPDSDALFRP
jgi:hypothetical protein